MSSSTLTRRSTVVHIYQGDDLDPLEDLRREVEIQAVKAGPTRIGDSESVLTAAAAYDAFLAEASERAVKVTLHAVGRRVWRDLVAKHPPRFTEQQVIDDAGNQTTETVPNEQDVQWGFNYDTLADDLVPACIESVVGDSRSTDAFLDDLSDGDWSRLYSAAVVLNQGAGPDPKAQLSSRLIRTSSETSESPKRLG